MGALSPIPLAFKTSAVSTVTASSQQFATTMASGVQYVLRSSTNCWWRADSSNPTAAATTAQNHFLAAGQSALISGAGNKVAIIRDAADGVASLSELGTGKL